MERPSFFRPADDLDMGCPSDDEVFANAPRMAARSMALIAKKRGVSAKTAPKTPAARSQPVWGDLATDDEDAFPKWNRAPEPVKPREPCKMDNQLTWDPIGLGTSTSPVVDLLWKKTDVKQDMGRGTVFDKSSWSTTASAEPLDELQTDDEDLSPQGAAPYLQPVPTPAQAMQETRLSQPQQNQLLSVQPQPQQLPMQQLQLQQPPPQTQPQQLQQMATLPVQQAGMFFAVPCMPMGMGMLPMVMSSRPNGTAPQKEQAAGPPMGVAHRFHQKNSSMGVMSADARTFTKKYNKGRLSIVSENKVHFQGTVRYSLQFTEGELCSADGVGFILSSDLPCTRNIQKIISVFANRTGRICIRVHDEVMRCSQRVKELDVGDWLEVNADLVNQTVTFTVWPHDNSAPSAASVSFKEVLENARGRVNGVPRNPCGFLAVVIKHLGVSVKLGS